VNLLVCELYRYQNARYIDKRKKIFKTYTGGNLDQDRLQRRAVLKNMMDLNVRETVGEFSEQLNDQYRVNMYSDLGSYFINWCVSGEIL